VNVDRVFDALHQVASDLVALVLASPHAHNTKVAATPPWTVADAFVHVAAEVPRYEHDALGVGKRAATPEALARENLHAIRNLTKDDLPGTAARMLDDLRSLEGTIRGFENEPPTVIFDGGAPVPADVAVGSLLGEFVIHGDDIARAIGAPWSIDPLTVPSIVEALNAILPGWVHAERARHHTATYELRLRGLESHYYEFTDGRLTIDSPHHRPPDLRIVGRPGDALLAMYSRRSPLAQLVTGRVVAYGRRPWLAARFATLFHPP
jgi:hypothetical protein